LSDISSKANDSADVEAGAAAAGTVVLSKSHGAHEP
jgi:hypothetical protein